MKEKNGKGRKRKEKEGEGRKRKEKKGKGSSCGALWEVVRGDLGKPLKSFTF